MSTLHLDAVLELSGVHKTYRLGQHVVPALQGVDLRVSPGEMLDVVAAFEAVIASVERGAPVQVERANGE